MCALKRKFVVVIAIGFILLSAWHPANAQGEEGQRPIDMMIVIDNSCSMFPEDEILPSCTEYGNDPDFLRIVGTDLFIARLGFAEVNEAEYQAGVISLGDIPELISPLQPLSGARDALARAIANPAAEPATRIVPALELAYRELRESPNRRPTNMPAIVLITDGKPYPLRGQSDADIESLISENADIPLFIMLLQNPSQPSAEFERYVKFWEQMRARYSHVFTHRIGEARQIEEAYNTIVAQLQNTVPSRGVTVSPDAPPLEVFVSRYVQKIVLTIIHESAPPEGTITIKDPTGVQVLDSDAGVGHFRGEENPIEIISISAPRLGEDLKEAFWTITSDKRVVVFLDRQGSYRLNFLSPSVSLTDVTNVYLATERQSPSRELVIRFSLLDMGSNPILEAQPIQGKVIYPDGVEDTLRIPADLPPDGEGIYEIRVDLAGLYPAILGQAGRFSFVLNAGSADERSPERIPIASARLLLDAGRGFFVDTVAPEPVTCAPDQPVQLTVTLGDYETALADTLRVRVIGSGGEEVALSAGDAGAFGGDITSLCTPLLAAMTCSTERDATFQIKLTGNMIDGTVPSNPPHSVPVHVVAPLCTPTPTLPPPTPTPTPPPTPTPVPDTDQDGFLDPSDQCPSTPKWDDLNQFEGCPPPWWLLILAGLLVLGLLAFIVFWLIPFVRVQITPPPKAYVLACGSEQRGAAPKSVYSIGRAKKANKVTIGGDRKKAHLYIKGLKPVEFRIEQQGDKVILIDAETGGTKATLTATAQTVVRTSNPEVTLRVSLDQRKLKC